MPATLPDRRKQLVEAARTIVGRNLTPEVVRVRLGLDAAGDRVTLVYETRSEPQDDGADGCEIAAAELAGEFAWIRTIELHRIAQAQCELWTEANIVVLPRTPPGD